MRSNTFKQTILKRQDKGTNDGYPSFFVRFVRGLLMPRYIWLVEVSYWDNWNPADPESPPVIADLILARIHRSETSVSLTPGMMGKGRRTGPARFQ